MEEYLSTAEAAKKLGLTRQGVAYLIKRKVINTQRIGRYQVISKEEIARVAKLDRKVGRPRRLTPGKQIK